MLLREEIERLKKVIASLSAGGVTSFNSRSGSVTPQTGDYSVAQISNYASTLAGTTNVSVFTPTLDYHVATKKYVDDNAGGGAGDMTKAVYDPNTIEGDAFDMDEMVEGATTKILTDTERTNVANGVTHRANTGNPHSVTKAQVGLTDADDTSDVDKPVSTAQQTALDLKADASHTHDHTEVTDYDTELAGTTNTTPFTPTADHHVATKKYVDDNAGGGSGDVVGPASATNNALARYDTTTGKLIQDSNWVMDDNGAVEATIGSTGLEALKFNFSNSSGRPITFYDNSAFVGGIDYNFGSNYFSFDLADASNVRQTDGFAIQSEHANYGYTHIGGTTFVERLTLEGALALAEMTAPSNTAGYGKIYVKSSDGKLYYQDDTGTETDLTAGGGGGGVDAEPGVYRGVAVSQVSATKTVVTIDTSTIVSANIALSANGMTPTDAGVYQIAYSIVLDDDGSSGATRMRVDAYCELDATIIDQSYSGVYTRESSGGSGLSATFLVDLPTGGEEIKLYTDGAGTTPDLSTDHVQISIHRVS